MENKEIHFIILMNIVFSGPKANILPGFVTNCLTDRITGVVET